MRCAAVGIVASQANQTPETAELQGSCDKCRSASTKRFVRRSSGDRIIPGDFLGKRPCWSWPRRPPRVVSTQGRTERKQIWSILTSILSFGAANLQRHPAGGQPGQISIVFCGATVKDGKGWRFPALHLRSLASAGQIRGRPTGLSKQSLYSIDQSINQSIDRR